ncbi:MAG: FAD:protein FMN transferase [Reyranellaceae bacterium]
MRYATRRRMLQVSAGLLGLGLGLSAPGARRLRWTGSALGANASIDLAGVEPGPARALIERTLAEIDRLESIFSLQRSGSALARLNREGQLADPPLELVSVLRLAAEVSNLSGGAFDITVQPLWRLYAEAAAKGMVPGARMLERVRSLIGWQDVEVSPRRIALRRPGASVTLNGIAQGFISDRVAELLRDAGLDNVYVSLGEQRATGAGPAELGWTVQTPFGQVELRNAALAVSAASPEGTVQDLNVPNLISAISGLPVTSGPPVVVTAPTAVIADAMATALAVAPPLEVSALIERMRTVRAVAMSPT